MEKIVAAGQQLALTERKGGLFCLFRLNEEASTCKERQQISRYCRERGMMLTMAGFCVFRIGLAAAALVDSTSQTASGHPDGRRRCLVLHAERSKYAQAVRGKGGQVTSLLATSTFPLEEAGIAWFWSNTSICRLDFRSGSQSGTSPASWCLSFFSISIITRTMKSNTPGDTIREP